MATRARSHSRWNLASLAAASWAFAPVIFDGVREVRTVCEFGKTSNIHKYNEPHKFKEPTSPTSQIIPTDSTINGPNALNKPKEPQNKCRCASEPDATVNSMGERRIM
jgi:hypothetical protein